MRDPTGYLARPNRLSANPDLSTFGPNLETQHTRNRDSTSLAAPKPRTVGKRKVGTPRPRLLPNQPREARSNRVPGPGKPRAASREPALMRPRRGGLWALKKPAHPAAPRRHLCHCAAIAHYIAHTCINTHRGPGLGDAIWRLCRGLGDTTRQNPRLSAYLMRCQPQTASCMRRGFALFCARGSTQDVSVTAVPYPYFFFFWPWVCGWQPGSGLSTVLWLHYAVRPVRLKIAGYETVGKAFEISSCGKYQLHSYKISTYKVQTEYTMLEKAQRNVAKKKGNIVYSSMQYYCYHHHYHYHHRWDDACLVRHLMQIF